MKNRKVTPKEVGRRIRAYRLKNRFTREQVAALLACSLTAYLEMESGVTRLNDSDIEDFCHLYGVDEEWITAQDLSGKDALEEF